MASYNWQQADWPDFKYDASGLEGTLVRVAEITGVSKSTATRDLQELARIGALTPIGAGRSARYEVSL